MEWLRPPGNPSRRLTAPPPPGTSRWLGNVICDPSKNMTTPFIVAGCYQWQPRLATSSAGTGLDPAILTPPRGWLQPLLPGGVLAAAGGVATAGGYYPERIFRVYKPRNPRKFFSSDAFLLGSFLLGGFSPQKFPTSRGLEGSPGQPCNIKQSMV